MPSRRFSLVTVFRLMGLDLLLARWHILIAALASLLVLLIISAMTASRSRDLTFHDFYAFPLLLFCAGLLVTSTLFVDCRPRTGSFVLTLPASPFEKLFSRFLLSLPVFIIAVSLFYLFYQVCSDSINSALFDSTHVSPMGLAALWSRTLPLYIGMHSVFFLGAVWFRRQAFIRTVLAAAAVILLVYLAERLLFSLVFHDIDLVRMPACQHLISFFDAVFFPIVQPPTLLLTTVTALSWLTAVVRYHELEV